jgi:hypothetical protein
MLYAHHADGPRAPGGRSARRLSASSSSSSSCVLVRLSFDSFGRVLLVHKVWRTVCEESPNSPRGVDGPRVEDGRSVAEGGVLVVQERFSEGPL